ncbi:MAG: molybdate ABC transporter substrate-binding protein [Candidatus Aquicultor sp.]
MIERRVIQLVSTTRDYEQPANSKWLGIFFALLSIIALASGCTGKALEKQKVIGSQPVQTVPAELNVSAAVSLKDALQKLASDFERENDVKLVFNFASSGDLQTQIEQGAPVDVFISAGKKQMDTLEEKKLIDAGIRSSLLGNELVLIVSQTSKQTIAKIEELAKAKDIKNIAIGMPEIVPAGKYAKETLQKAGIWENAKPKLVMAKDVRQVIEYVETGNAGAGFAYRSDVKASGNSGKVQIALVIPDAYHSPIIYPIAVVTDTKQCGLSTKFIEYLKSMRASEIFREFNFKPLVK